jgi:hypothetical protein
MSDEEYKSRHLTVVSRPRQMRVAYLVDPASTSLDMLDALFAACANTWGGRLFPIVPVIDGTISPGYWSLLRTVDPDSIYSYATLPQTLVDRLLSEINPLVMEGHPPHLMQGEHPCHAPSHHNRLIRVNRILSFATEVRWFRKPTLVTYSSRTGETPNKLIARNFGLLRNDILSEPIPENISQVSFDVADDLAAFLERLTDQRERFVFPFAASAARAVVDSGIGRHETTYTVYIGDDLESWISNWNHIFTLGAGSRADWKMFCLPPAELGNAKTVEALTKFFRRYAYRNGNHPPYINWTSANLTEDELKALAAPFQSKKLDAYFGYSRREPWSFPELPVRERYSFEFRGSSLGSPELFGVSAHQIPASGGLVNLPGLPFVTALDEPWIQDVRIQYVAEHPYYSNEDLQYQLPRRSGIARCFCALPGRVDADGGLSFMKRRQDPLYLKIPEDRELILVAIGCGRRGGYDENLHYREISPVYQDHGPSDKARYCRGVLNLFEGLQSAHDTFENRFWRETLFQLAGIGCREPGEPPSIVLQKITKHPERWTIDPTIPQDEEARRIETEIVKLTQHVRVRENETTFQRLEQHLLRERAEFLAQHQEIAGRRGLDPQAELKEAQGDLRRAMQGFVDAKIMRQGTVARCRHCGSRIWREISDLEREFNCTGCGAIVRTPVEPTWYYRLNTLVRSAINQHGTVALIHGLSEARERARHSFIYSPGLEFYENFEDTKPVAEIDAICLVDGSLWIGEVKTNAAEFKPKEMEKLLREAQKMNADKAFVYASEGNQEVLGRRCEEVSKASGIPVLHLQPGSWALTPSFHI